MVSTLAWVWRLSLIATWVIRLVRLPTRSRAAAAIPWHEKAPDLLRRARTARRIVRPPDAAGPAAQAPGCQPTDRAVGRAGIWRRPSPIRHRPHRSKRF